MQKELLEQYAALDAECRHMEELKIRLRSQILADLELNHMEKVESDYGSFTVAHKTSWVYSPAVTKIEEKLKIARHKEQTKGLAKAEVSSYLLFKTREVDLEDQDPRDDLRKAGIRQLE